MAKNYKALTESVRSRINPENLTFEKSFRDELLTISYRDVLVYIRLAMKGVEPEYTQRSKDAGEKVKDHLRSKLSDVTFQYQGSVMTNMKNAPNAILYDIQSTLTGIDDTIEMILQKGYQGRSKMQEIIEQRELYNFKRVLQMQIDKSPYAKTIVEICDEF